MYSAEVCSFFGLFAIPTTVLFSFIKTTILYLQIRIRIKEEATYNNDYLKEKEAKPYKMVAD